MIAPAAKLPANHPIRTGFATFQKLCMVCHTLNGGGDATLGRLEDEDGRDLPVAEDREVARVARLERELDSLLQGRERLIERRRGRHPRAFRTRATISETSSSDTTSGGRN